MEWRPRRGFSLEKLTGMRIGFTADGMVEDIIGIMSYGTIFVGMSTGGPGGIIGEGLFRSIRVMDRERLAKGIIGFYGFIPFGINLFYNVS
jgi:hypothetical protein